MKPPDSRTGEIIGHLGASLSLFSIFLRGGPAQSGARLCSGPCPVASRALALLAPGPAHSARSLHPCDPQEARSRVGSLPLPPGPRRRLTSCPPQRRGSPRWPAGACAGAGSCTRPGPAPGPRHSGLAAPAPARQEGTECRKGGVGAGTQDTPPLSGRTAPGPRERLCSCLASSHWSMRPGGGIADLAERVPQSCPASLQPGKGRLVPF